MTTSSLTLGPGSGRLLLRTTAEGRAARMGHALTLLVQEWECVAELVDGAPVAAEVTMQLGSLEVLRGDGGLKPLSDGDKRKILAGAAKTLSSRHPTRFVTRSIRPEWVLTGDLSLHGVTREQTVQVTVAEVGDELRIMATTTVRQGDHGITPYSQALGTLKVGNEVSVLVEVAVARP